MKCRCSMCGRVLLAPKVRMGQMTLGPRCAEKAGFIESKQRFAPVARVVRDKRTVDMFEKEAA